MRHFTAIPIFIIALLAATLACGLGPTTSNNNQLSRPQSTAYIPPIPTNTPTPEASESSSSSSQNTSNSSHSVSNSNSSSSSGSNGSSGSGYVACNPRTDWYVYRVVSGDTLAAIARRVNSNVNVLAAANCLANANTIRVGQALYVPQLPIPTNTPIPNVARSGYVVPSPYLFADANHYFLKADYQVTLTYTDAPSGTARVDFAIVYANGSRYVIGSDSTFSDGVNITWVPASETFATFEAVALRADGSIIQRSVMTDFGTSKSIPSATCVLQAVTLTPVDIKQEPTAGATKWGDLIPGQWMAVAGRTSDGWIAVHPTPASSLTIYDMVWVATSDLVQFQGPCNSLKTIHIDLPSSGCFVTGTPDIAIPTYDRPHDNSTPTGSLNAGTSYEIRGYTSTGWYGIYVGSPDIAPDRYGAYGLRWIKDSISLPPGPQCGTLPLIY